jgi:hypothetical protein
MIGPFDTENDEPTDQQIDWGVGDRASNRI